MFSIPSVEGDDAMRKWYFPMTVLGLGGLGVLLFSERGRRSLQRLVEFLPEAPQHLAEWNETAQRELDRIQDTLNQVAEQLEAGSFPAISARP
jgi:hypothetical protein